ncbi:class I SAM-dependent methyltransferase [Desulfoscipio sp. XC116]|uniref:class I SAM-dependent methyltransferase n=1 Tax=Desulfoscipio sp. XC116 TaxID=3144975 RepID=UPI00325BCD30
MQFNERIKTYWEGEAEGYSQGIERELRDFHRKAWKELILEYAPKKSELDILDIGTGPGFFPIILSEGNHRVTGIDLTENMIRFAKKNLEAEGCEATLLSMDCHNLAFEDNSFDLVICRNLTWTLDNPSRAYEEWLRVLRTGGRLLVFDACWYLHLFDEKKKKAYFEKEKEIKEKYGRKFHEHRNQAEGEELSKKLFMSDKVRPLWDLEKMLSMGFSKVFANCSIDKRTCNEMEIELHSLRPSFLVGGEK